MPKEDQNEENIKVKKYLCDQYLFPAKVIEDAFKRWSLFKSLDLDTVKNRIEKIEKYYDLDYQAIRKIIINNPQVLLYTLKNLKTKQAFLCDEYGITQESFKEIICVNSQVLNKTFAELSDKQKNFEEICGFNKKQFGKLIEKVNSFPNNGVFSTKNKILLLEAFGAKYDDIMREPGAFTVPYDKLVIKLFLAKINNYPINLFLKDGYKRSEKFVYARMKAIENKKINEFSVFSPEHIFVEKVGRKTTELIEMYPFDEKEQLNIYENFVKNHPDIYEKIKDLSDENDMSLLGITKEEYNKLITINPDLMDFQFDHIREYQLFFCSKLRIPKEVFVDSIIKNPSILKYDYNTINDALIKLRSHCSSRFELLKVIRKNHEILDKGVDFYLKRLDFLNKNFGLDEKKYKAVLMNNKEVFYCSEEDILLNQKDLEDNSGINKKNYGFLLTKIHSIPSFNSEELNFRKQVLEKLSYKEEEYMNETKIVILNPKIDLETRYKLCLLIGKNKKDFLNHGLFIHDENRVFARWMAFLHKKLNKDDIYSSNDNNIRWYSFLNEYPLTDKEKQKIDDLFEQKFYKIHNVFKK